MATYQYLDGLNKDGTILGQDTSALISFHNAAPCDQSAAATSVSTTAVTSSSPFGFVTTAQGTALVTAVNTIITCLKEKGLMA